MEIGKIDVFLEAVTIVSAYKVLRKQFQKPETIGLILRAVIAVIRTTARKP